MTGNFANYFPHDSNARNSDKLIPVRMKHGAAGYGIYFMLLERLREEKDYMSIKDYNTLAFDLRVDSSTLKSVVEDFGLFDFTTINGREFFYSEGFQKRMELKDKKANERKEKARNAAKARWNKDDEAQEEREESSSNAQAMLNDAKESKEKESKEKNNKKESGSLKEDFEKLWKLYPKKQGKKKAFDSYKRAIKSGTTNKEIQDGIVAYKKYLAAVEWLQPANGSTWFNQERWQDDYSLPNDQSPDNDADLSWLNDPEIMGEDAYERTT